MLIGVNGRLSIRMVAPHLLWPVIAVGVTLYWIRKAPPPDPTRESASTIIAPVLLIGFVCLYLLSIHTLHRWFFHLNWVPQEGERFLKSGLATCCLGVVILTPLMLWRPRWTWIVLLAGLILFPVPIHPQFSVGYRGTDFSIRSSGFYDALARFPGNLSTDHLLQSPVERRAGGTL